MKHEQKRKRPLREKEAQCRVKLGDKHAIGDSLSALLEISASRTIGADVL
jgi:hypothetical protein